MLLRAANAIINVLCIVFFAVFMAVDIRSLETSLEKGRLCGMTYDPVMPINKVIIFITTLK